MASREGIVDARVQQAVNANRQTSPDGSIRTVGPTVGGGVGRPGGGRGSPDTGPTINNDAVSVGEQKYLDAIKPLERIIFPADLQNDDSARPYVMFYIYDTYTETISGAVKDDIATKGYKTGINQLFNTARSIGEVGNRQVAAGALEVAGDVGTALLDKLEVLAGNTTSGSVSSELKRRFEGFSLKRNIQKSSDVIVLFMPDSLQANYEHNYDEISVTATLGAAGMLAQALADSAGGAKGASDPFVLEAASKVAGRLPGVQSSEELTNLLLFGTTGRAINPQMEVLYNSPRLRTFTFDFRLVPRSQPEAETIQKIVNKFKYYSAPTIEANTSGRYYIPPSRFILEFHHRGKENPYLFKTRQCVLESISLDYAPNGYATHYDGAPIETRMQLIFKETTMISRADLDPGNPDFRGGSTF